VWGLVLVNGYTAAWIAWGAAFIAVETKAILDGRSGTTGETLSEHLRRMFGTSKGSNPIHRALGTSALLLAVLWFVPHILNP
jgi:hypothetical protein